MKKDSTENIMSKENSDNVSPKDATSLNDEGNDIRIHTTSNSYLQLRETKIARNKDKLARLGLAGKFHDASILNGGVRSNNAMKVIRKGNGRSSGNDNDGGTNSSQWDRGQGQGQGQEIATRRSNRLRKRPSSIRTDSEQKEEKETTHLEHTLNGQIIGKEPEDKGMILPTNAKRVRKLSSSTTTPSEPKPGTTRATYVNVRRVLYGDFDYPIFVGRRLSQSNKAAVVEHANFMCGNDRGISFNKYSGVCEFRNDVLFLWVNIDAPNADVRNEFLNDGTQIVWWGGSKMHDESPVIQRLISIGRRFTKNSDNENDLPDKDDCGIVLWCRMYNSSKRTFDPYSCMGRLGYHSHDVGSRPLRFVFDLLDYEYLKNTTEPDGINHYKAFVSATSG